MLVGKDGEDHQQRTILSPSPFVNNIQPATMTVKSDSISAFERDLDLDLSSDLTDALKKSMQKMRDLFLKNIQLSAKEETIDLYGIASSFKKNASSVHLILRAHLEFALSAITVRH